MQINTATPTAQPTPHRVTVRRVLLEWSYADDTPFVPDEIDAMIFRASTLARLVPA